jgi:hypothetical protein
MSYLTVLYIIGGMPGAEVVFGLVGVDGGMIASIDSHQPALAAHAYRGPHADFRSGAEQPCR